MDTKPPRANLLQTAGQRTAAGARSGSRGGKGLWLLLIFSPCVGFTFTHLLHLISPPPPCTSALQMSPTPGAQKADANAPLSGRPAHAAWLARVQHLWIKASLRPPAESSTQQTVFIHVPATPQSHPQFHPLAPSREPHSDVRVSVSILSSTLLRNWIHPI